MKLSLFSCALYLEILTHVLGENSFTSCRGSPHSTALLNCEDFGIQQKSSGGNVIIVVRNATNMPNRDSTGPSSKVSDPYVKFTTGNVNKKTKYIRDSLNPVWNEAVNLGFLSSATSLNVEIWDKDTGLEFSDDLMLHNIINVPFCSALYATDMTYDCGEPFGCEVSESLWPMPTRKVCKYTGVVKFTPGPAVLFLEIFITPLVMEVEYLYPTRSTPTPKMGVMGTASSSAIAPAWIRPYGQPYWDSSVLTSGQSNPQGDLVGALMLRTAYADRNLGSPNEVQFYVGINFPSDLYVCRHQDDNSAALPYWIASQYSSARARVDVITFGTDTRFSCFKRHVTGTVKNKWGGVLGGAVPFYSNVATSGLSTQYNYFILAVPKVVSSVTESVVVAFDSLSFLSFMASYGLVWAYFVGLADRFLDKIDYRVDRISAWLASRVLTGDKRSVLAGLFVTNGQSPSNVQYRAHMFHARNSIVFVLCVPFLLLISWGFSCVAAVRPPAMGYGVAFGGISAMFLWFGLKLWQRSHWRLSPMTLVALSLAVLFLVVLLLSVIFADVAVLQHGMDINFTSLSLVFGTINCVPLLLLTFKQDRRQSAHFREVLVKLHEALTLQQQNAATKKKQTARSGSELKVNRLLHGLLEGLYSVNPQVPAFRFSAVMQELPEDVVGKDANSAAEDAEDRDAVVSKYQEEHRLYGLSLLALLIYLIIAAARTEYASLAFLHILALMLLDGIHLSVSHGDMDWTSGFKIALLMAGRLLVMGSPTSIWVVNYSAAYMLYGCILAREMINAFLPTISQRQAGEIAFAGREPDPTPSADIAGTSYFCLGLLTFAFSSILLVCAYKSAEDELPIPDLNVLGLVGWPVYVFGLVALMLTVIISLMAACVRALYLERHGLLRGWAKSSYLIRKEVTVPIALAMFAELSILTFGILIYASTGAVAVLVGAIYLPIIVMILGYACQVWVHNDFDLVRWPPTKEDEANKDGKSASQQPHSDLEAAFDIIENLFRDDAPSDEQQADGQDAVLLLTNVEEGEGPETESKPDPSAAAPQPERTLKGFKLPPMRVTGNKLESEIKMPPLPLKSVLRRKRQNLGIKTRLPIVNDLRVREDAVDPDRFGDSGEVADLEDPWAQFEREAEEEAAERRKKKGTTFAVGKKESFWKNSTLVAVRKSKVCQWMSRTMSTCVSFCQRKAKVYPSIYKPTGEQEDDDVEKGTFAVAELTEGVTEDEDRELTPADIAKLPYSTALWGGYLSHRNYLALGAWYGGLLMIMFFGVTLSLTVSPVWMGHVIWVSVWMFLLTAVPVVKYFNTYTFDDSMQSMAQFVALFHFVFCLSFFLAKLRGDIGVLGSLWLLDWFFYYPIVLYVGFALFRWYDADFQVIRKDFNGDGDLSMLEFLRYYSAVPLTAFLVIFTWQLYIWINQLTGVVATLALLTAVTALLFLRDWAGNDYHVSHAFLVLGGIALKVILFVTACVSLLSDTNPILPLSIFCFVLAFQQVTRIVSRLSINNQDVVVFFSPFVCPVYSYDAKTHDVVDESAEVRNVFNLLLVGVVWGVLMAIFFHPINVGVALACSFLLCMVAAAAFAVSYVPMKLAKMVAMFSPESIIDAAGAAKERFAERRQPLRFEVADWEGEEALDAVNGADGKSSLDRQKERTSLAIALELMSDLRSLKHVKDEVVENTGSPEEEQDEYELPWHRQLLADAREFFKKVFEMLPTNKKAGWRRHSQGVFTWPDVLMEWFITGRGPFGLLGAEGYWYRFLVRCKESPGWIKYYPTWLDSFDSSGNDLRLVQLSDNLDVPGLLANVVEFDKALDWTYHEESRCAVHFFLLLVVGADAKLQREQVLFQKFLRENRFRLASNGITPPPNIFSSTSFASINIPLVAVWLSTLSIDERDRFHQLKAAFSAEQRDKDELVDNSDFQTAFEAQQLLRDREGRDKEMSDKLSVEIIKRKEQRVQEFADSCEGYEKQKFQNRRELWVGDPNCFVDLKDVELYERFRVFCLAERNEAKECIQQALMDIEAAQRDTRLGEYGRAYQFVDSEFQPGDSSVGHGECASYVLGWRCAPGISDTVQLFDGGTHPDEVSEGVFRDAWLLSAINMLVAAGEVGGGYINEQVKDLFVTHSSADGEPTLHTEVGAYCIQLFKNNEWFPVLLDDLLPMRKKEHWTNENRGMACAHNKECHGLWVSLVEKAFAKYLGSYSMLERGYVHHALQDLTGCEAECLPLSAASRGIGKRALWDSLVRYRRNGYILGAGTGDSKLVDREILDLGIVFNSAYTIYDVRKVNGHRLLKLRNPPGNHDEWKGDWGDKSALWSRKLKRKLGHLDAADNTFFMSFDDFCNVFRHLYVCKYYNPKKWIAVQHPGLWKRSDEAAVEQMDMMNQFLAEQGEDVASAEVDVEAVNRKKAKARLDSAGGLPNKHNPGCVLENNPHYSMRVYRPTDLRISVTQFNNKGSKAAYSPVPFSVLVVRNPHPHVPMRLQTLVKEDVVCSSGHPRRDKTINLYADGLRPGLYMVLVATYVSGMEGGFTVNLLSNYRTEFLPVWPPLWMLKGDKMPASETLNARIGGTSTKAKKVSGFLQRGLKALVGSGGEHGDDDEPDSDEDD